MDELEQHGASVSSDVVEGASTSQEANPDGTETSCHEGELKRNIDRDPVESLREERGGSETESNHEIERRDSPFGKADAWPSQPAHNLRVIEGSASGIEGSVSGDLDVLMAIRTLEAVEKDAETVAGSFCSLLTSLQTALSEMTTSSVDHMQCYCEVAGQVQDAALDAATKGNRFINACLRLNEEMKGMDILAAQLKTLRRTVDRFEYQANKFLPRT